MLTGKLQLMTTMTQIIDYRILKEYTVEDLQENVKRLMRDGWEIHGLTYMNVFENEDYEFCAFYQAMIYKNKERDNGKN